MIRVLPGPRKRGCGDAENFSRTAAEHQLVGLDGMRFGDSLVEGSHGRVGIAIRKMQCVLHGGDNFLRGAVGIFVAAENDRAAGRAGAG